MMAKFGVPAVGFWGFFAATAAVSLGFAFGSWHLVEKPALRGKDWTPRLPGRRTPRTGAEERGEPVVAPPRADAPVQHPTPAPAGR